MYIFINYYKTFYNNKIFYKMFSISIEPTYSQGVGNFELITDNIENIKKFRNELLRYKNHLVSSDDVDGWEFHECIYKLIDFVPNKNNKIFNGICLWNEYYFDDFGELKSFTNIDFNKLDTNKIYKFEYNEPIIVNHVYNYIDTSIKPIHIDNFDIIGKNYFK